MTSLPLLDDSVQNTASASMAGEGFCSIDPHRYSNRIRYDICRVSVARYELECSAVRGSFYTWLMGRRYHSNRTIAVAYVFFLVSFSRLFSAGVTNFMRLVRM